MIYIVFFLISCFLIWLSEKSSSRYIGKLLAFIAILLPCILAGMRADTIGTDLRVYVEPMYNAAKQSTSFSSYMDQRWYVIWRYMYVNKFEIGFTTLVYLIEKLGGSLGISFVFYSGSNTCSYILRTEENEKVISCLLRNACFLLAFL